MPAEPIADNDPSVQRTLQRTIASAGWRVETYASGVVFLDSYHPSQKLL